jgi:UDP-N-acetylmuramoyl-L-alanyl-D-glutamate--2,6-diaminopimelate ligase
MILEGVKESGCEGIFVGDREGAIERAIAMAHKGDLVLILGKGDESYMYYEEGRRPWIGDNEAARRALKKVMAKDKH